MVLFDVNDKYGNSFKIIYQDENNREIALTGKIVDESDMFLKIEQSNRFLFLNMNRIIRVELIKKRIEGEKKDENRTDKYR